MILLYRQSKSVFCLQKQGNYRRKRVSFFKALIDDTCNYSLPSKRILFLGKAYVYLWLICLFI